jgi:hypothetical protein
MMKVDKDTGAPGNPVETVEEKKASLAVQIAKLEQTMVLEAFNEMKQRGDAEMRVASRRDRATGMIEITYIGVHEKADLEGLRDLYKRVKRGMNF